MALALLAAAPASAQQPPMTVAEFLAKAAPIEKRGMAGLLFSRDARRLGQELGRAADALRAAQTAARREGRAPPACLPPKGKAKVDARELLTFLRALPPAERGTSFRDAFFRYGARKYPCART